MIIKELKAPDLIEENLPFLVDLHSLAGLLDLSGGELWGLLKGATRINAGAKESLYSSWDIPKKNGGVRTLYAPKGPLKGVQTKIRDRIIDLCPKSGVSVAYRKGMCPGDTARKIAGSPVIIKLDIKDFFPSIRQTYVRGYFESLGYSSEVANLLGGLLCVKVKHKRFVPQGGTASPMLANRVAEMLIDPEVLKVLPKGWQYVRYCDNLYVWPETKEASDGTKHSDLLKEIRMAVFHGGFSSHQGSIVPYYRSQRLLGLTVNRKANMPKERYKALRACLFNCSKQGLESQMHKAVLLGFQTTGDLKIDRNRFIAFLKGLLNYYSDYLTPRKSSQLYNWLSLATRKEIE